MRFGPEMGWLVWELRSAAAYRASTAACLLGKFYAANRSVHRPRNGLGRLRADGQPERVWTACGLSTRWWISAECMIAAGDVPPSQYGVRPLCLTCWPS